MACQHPDTCLVIFAKSPLPGKVKTRLIPVLGKEGACQLYKSMAQKIITNLSSANVCHVHLYIHPVINHGFFKDLQKANELTMFQQEGKDLGDRMSHAIDVSLKDHAKVIIIGTDCPEYSADYIEQAIYGLDDKDVVIGPAKDGGYVLIGMKQPHSHLFTQIDWGKSTVLDKTLKKIDEISLHYQLLQALHDIDVPADLKFHS